MDWTTNRFSPHITPFFSSSRPHFKTLCLCCAVRRSRLYSRQRTRHLHFTTRTLLAFYGMYHATRASMLAPYLFAILRMREREKRRRKKGITHYMKQTRYSRIFQKIRDPSLIKGTNSFAQSYNNPEMRDFWDTKAAKVLYTFASK